MSKIILVAQVCMFNEIEKGNLARCLDNLRRYCDHIVIYDDASTDDSVAVAESHGAHIIRGEVNNQLQELAHKQAILKKSLDLGATYLFWLDCDEVLDRAGTLGGLRELCENFPQDLDAYSFRELNLWRSQAWVRTDTLFTKARFVRLWKVAPGISFNIRKGVHLQLYPKTIGNIQEAPFRVIHYGFHDYKKMLVKIGANGFNRKELQENALTNWILDESKCSCYRLPDDEFPPGCVPPHEWPQPEPRDISELVPYDDLPECPSYDARPPPEKQPEAMPYDAWREWWVKLAPEYFTDKIWKFSQPRLIDKLSVERHHCVLEIGFGYGREISQFCGLSDNVYGLELTEWACENTLRELTERGVSSLPILRPYDGRMVPFPTEAFHIIYNCFVIQHLSREHAKNLIREALRAVKAGGQALFEFFGDPAYYSGGQDVFSGRAEEGGMFNNAYTEAEIPGVIESCGGELFWMKPTPITKAWSNYWVCFGRKPL